MSVATYDIAAVRRQFPALAAPTAFLDGPAGTQVPRVVVEAMNESILSVNANIGGAFEGSERAGEALGRARIAAARFLGGTPEEIGFGVNMTTLNFALTRTVARTFKAGDEVIVTELDHDANIAPWLHLERDLGIVVRIAPATPPEGTIDPQAVADLLSERTRVVAFPWSSNALGTTTDVARIAELAHEAGALAWVDAVHHAPHGPIDVEAVDADVLLCSPYKFFGPHVGVFYVKADIGRRWDPYKVRPSPEEPVAERFETGTLPHEAIAGIPAAIEYLESLGWPAIQQHERSLAAAFLSGLPDGYVLYGVRGTTGRVPTFALNHPSLSALDVATRLAERDIAVWHGDYYAPQIMERFDLQTGAVRIGFVHYNTHDEVDRALAALTELL